MLVLGIETSCDDTAAAVLEAPRRVLSSVVSSQVEFHRKYGGVVPEIASRRHMENILPVIEAALEEAGVELEGIELFAVTRGPGLPGSLLVGLMVAKAMAFSKKRPLIGVNHLMGHLFSPLLEREMEFPFLGLVVSGGHTALYLVEDFLRIRLLGQTRDDAAGEAFDKVSRLLGLGYPGGPVIDRLSERGDPQAIPFPRPMLQEGYWFSFSGLKTAVRNFVASNPDYRLEDLVASFQEAVCDVLLSKCLRASEAFGIRRIAVAGGVAANRRLREMFLEAALKRGLEVFFPSPKYCTDNAAMIALCGYELFLRGQKDGYEIGALPRWPLGDPL